MNNIQTVYHLKFYFTQNNCNKNDDLGVMEEEWESENYTARKTLIILKCSTGLRE